MIPCHTNLLRIVHDKTFGLKVNAPSRAIRLAGAPILAKWPVQLLHSISVSGTSVNRVATLNRLVDQLLAMLPLCLEFFEDSTERHTLSTLDPETVAVIRKDHLRCGRLEEEGGRRYLPQHVEASCMCSRKVTAQILVVTNEGRQNRMRFGDDQTGLAWLLEKILVQQTRKSPELRRLFHYLEVFGSWRRLEKQSTPKF